ncbi:MAG: Glutathione synthase/RimK-type ligase, ATP-grasp superfamily [Nocardioides sp.]|nr:Glutathione synthase/RimK-type ligase, ATP-grasp superfamily [Nocardioides sp.]
MRIALVITDVDFYEDTGYAASLVAALQAQGAEVDRFARVPPQWYGDGPPVGRYDLALTHVLVEEVAGFGETMRAAALLEAAGVPLVNPVAAIVTSSDKALTHAVWAAAGLPQPRVWSLADCEGWPAPGRALVLKPALGDGARYISVVRDLDGAREVEADWRADEVAGGHRRGAALLQELVEEPTVLRLFATPTASSLVYEKNREPGEIVSHGTVYARAYEAPPALADLTQRMVATLGGGLMGVDVLVDAAGRHLALEANAPFGFDVTDPEQARWVAQAVVELGRRPGRARSA